MDRREALKRVGALMGGTMSLSIVSGVMSGCQAPAAGGYTMQTLSEAQGELVATISELIIPTTDTPGARAAKVHEFIDLMLTDWFEVEDKDHFLAGLVKTDEMAQAANGSSFVDNTEAQQIALLTEMEAAAQGGSGDKPFFTMMKELTLTGYYTSEIGASQELKYVHVAGEYRGDVPYSEIGRAYS